MLLRVPAEAVTNLGASSVRRMRDSTLVYVRVVHLPVMAVIGEPPTWNRFQHFVDASLGDWCSHRGQDQGVDDLPDEFGIDGMSADDA